MKFTQGEESLEKKAVAIRKSILEMVFRAQSGHIGGSFSATELLVVLFYEFLKIDPQNPSWDARDYFILSKGHITPLYYSILANLGFFQKEELISFRQIDGILQGHPKLGIPGVEASTGSLGQGFGNAAGIALALKYRDKNNKVVALLGDGELQEGVIWETAMAVGHFKLSNLLTIVDWNEYQTDGAVKDIMNVEPIMEKFQAFGFYTKLIDGHDIDSIREAYRFFYSQGENYGLPIVIIAKTIKGKGVSFMENTAKWHGSSPDSEKFQKALQELLEGENSLGCTKK